MRGIVSKRTHNGSSYLRIYPTSDLFAIDLIDEPWSLLFAVESPCC